MLSESFLNDNSSGVRLLFYISCRIMNYGLYRFYFKKNILVNYPRIIIYAIVLFPIFSPYLI